MLQLTLNIKPYRNLSSYDMINKLLETKLVKVQKDELTKLRSLKRPLYKEEREYVVRLFVETFKPKEKQVVQPVVEITITCFEDLSIFKNNLLK